MTVITQRITWHNDKWSSCIECTCTWSGHLCAYDLAETRNVEIVKLLVCTDESHKHTCCENHSNTNKFFSKLSPTRTSQVCDLAERHSLWPRRTSQSVPSLRRIELQVSGRALRQRWCPGSRPLRCVVCFWHCTQLAQKHLPQVTCGITERWTALRHW